MKDCFLIEDLWPLYEEGLVQPKTKEWIEHHVQQCESCRQLLDSKMETVIIPETTLNPNNTISKTILKLHVYQLLLVVLSFVFAINTTLLSNSGFQFILSYFVLGIVVYYFYKNWLLTVLIAFLPTCVWSLYDAVMSYDSFANWWQQSLQTYPSKWHFISENLLMSAVLGVLHTLFTVLGICFVVLIQTAFKKENEA